MFVSDFGCVLNTPVRESRTECRYVSIKDFTIGEKDPSGQRQNGRKSLENDFKTNAGRIAGRDADRGTHDFEVAIEEGATMVRIGSALFGDRQ